MDHGKTRDKSLQVRFGKPHPAPACAAMLCIRVELFGDDVLAGRVAPIFGDNGRRHFLKPKRSEKWAGRNVTALIVLSRA